MKNFLNQLVSVLILAILAGLAIRWKNQKDTAFKEQVKYEDARAKRQAARFNKQGPEPEESEEPEEIDEGGGGNWSAGTPKNYGTAEVTEKTESRMITCPNCNGTKTEEKPCDHCDEDAYGNRKIAGGYKRNSTCTYCKGSGLVEKPCRTCYGKGRVTEYE